jgi:predicted metal-dependent phosphoesterase TrpH
MSYADLHIHTTYSHDGTCTVQQVLDYVANNTGLSIIAITDHDEIVGSLMAEILAPIYGLQVVTGSEITTADGHLLALFIRERVPAGLSLVETLHRIHQLGGIAIAAHPETRFTHSLKRQTIFDALKDPIARQTLVGIEVFNAGLFRKESNQSAMQIAGEIDISLVASSDAHVEGLIGKGATGFAGRTTSDLREALVNHSTHIVQYQPVSSSYLVFSWLYKKFINQFNPITAKPSLS